MWVFLFGNKIYLDILGYIINRCPDCRVSTPFTIEQERKKFTVFFIPTFQYSKKQFMICDNCHQVFEVAEELKVEVAGNLMKRKELEMELERRRLERERATPRCNICNSLISQNMVFCPQCGQKL